jgi:hypothetical protein
MSVLLFEFARPEVEVGLQIVVHRIEPLAEGDAVELVGCSLLEALDNAVVRARSDAPRGPAEATRTRTALLSGVSR